MDAVSEDERETVDGEEYYFIVQQDWRSTEADDLYEILDALHMSTHFSANDRPHSGRFSHIRKSSNRMFEGPAPECLPSNFYKSEYLSGLSEDQKEFLNMKSAADLSFPAKLMRYIAVLCSGTELTFLQDRFEV